MFMQRYTHPWKWFWYLVGLIRPFGNKKDRKIVYQVIYNSMKNYKDQLPIQRYGFCSHILALTGNSIPLYKFPELYYYRPMATRRFLWWFPTEDEGMEKRLEILKKII